MSGMLKSEEAHTVAAPVASLIGSLGCEVAALDETVRVLLGRLVDVSSGKAEKPPAEDDSKPQRQYCKLGTDISDATKAIAALRERLDDQVSRLEI